jgi:hypothetical protein
VHPYPTRYHGGIWVRPEFGLPYVMNPLFVPREVNGEIALQGEPVTDDGVFRNPTAGGGGVFNQSLSGDSSSSLVPFLVAFVVTGALTYGVLTLMGSKK